MLKGDLFYGLRKEEEKNFLSTAHSLLWGMKEGCRVLPSPAFLSGVNKKTPTKQEHSSQLLQIVGGKEARKGGAGSGNLFGLLK